MLKAGSIIVAISSSISVSQGAVCSEAGKALILNEDIPSLDLISKCTSATIDADIAGNCFYPSNDAIVGLENVSMDCASCIYGTMTTPLVNPDYTVNSYLSATYHLLEGFDCTPDVDTLISFSVCMSTAIKLHPFVIEYCLISTHRRASFPV
jgi:hypothetical protein